MTRSLWKGPFIELKLFKDLKKLKNIKTKSRTSTIVPSMLGKIIHVYSGRYYIPLEINEDMVGFKLGSFIFTRLPHIHKNKNKNVNKKGKKRKKKN